MTHSRLPDPTAKLDLDFSRYVQARERKQAAHMAGGVPDYAFSLDWKIRRNLDRLAPLRALAQAINAGTVPVQQALFEVHGVAVGPKQFPELHAMGVDCAERLGIGVPRLFVLQDPTPNAFTFATGHVDQIVVVTGGLLDAMNWDEVRFVIGHECGHIHNRHVVYNTLWELLTNGVARPVLERVVNLMGPAGWFFKLLNAALTVSAWYALGRWHRCAEITCDRAGLICSGDVDAALSVNGKLHLGAAGELEGFNAEEYRKQAQTYNKSLVRLFELTMSHPPGPKRTEATELFSRCEVLAAWRPELDLEGPLHSREFVDAHIEKLII